MTGSILLFRADIQYNDVIITRKELGEQWVNTRDTSKYGGSYYNINYYFAYLFSYEGAFKYQIIMFSQILNTTLQNKQNKHDHRPLDHHPL